MSVPLWVWGATIAGLLAVLAVDLFVIGRDPHKVTMKEASLWVGAMALLAVAFGFGLTAVAGGAFGGQFFAGWITEYSLSVDNLFVFVIVIGRFAVPDELQHRVLLIGVLIALALRGVFIALGSAIINSFTWAFYVFGAFLIITAVKLAVGGAEPEYRENVLVRLARRVYPTTDRYHGVSMTVRIDGRRTLTPMLLVVIAIGATDVLFALDSIPAVFGLTKQAYIVFTANIFALLGLRQLYFLVDGLLDRLIFLSKGLAFVLGFIGVKMVFEAMHGTGIEHVGPVAVPTISIPVSLGVIVGVLAVTTVLSLAVERRRGGSSRRDV
jgi:tellurite resistance protein TerC